MTADDTPPTTAPGEQPVGELIDFRGATRPEHPLHLAGRYVELGPLDPPADAGPLYALTHPPAGDPTIWTYLFDGPYESPAAYQRALTEDARSSDPLFFTVVTRADERARGIMSYLAIVPEHGTIEIGNIWFGDGLRRTPAATEAVYLLAHHAFETLGYRRLEWKCNALNAPSRRAAERFGFAFEGIFAQHKVVKGRNRDTAWFAITDVRWRSGLSAAFEAWLDPSNFDPAGHQHRTLSDLTERSTESDAR